MSRGTVLLVEDESAAVRVMTLALQRENFQVHAAGEAAAALAMVDDVKPEVVVADYLLPGMDGMEMLRFLQRRAPDLPVVMVTGHGDERVAAEAMKLGAFDYLPKPLDYDELSRVLRRAVELRRLRIEARSSRIVPAASRILGSSPAIERLRALISDLAPADVTLLLHGETGTGKELVARAIHDASRRARKRFVALNCAAIPETLLESELFGYVRGAFTGADGRREGKILAATGGTLFLDEIGDFPQSLQPKLLRVLEEGELTPLGSDQPQRVDIRLIAASHRDLRAEVNAGRFRADLFYRLNVVPIELPPLRERPSDIPLLVQGFLARSSQRHGVEIRSVEPSLIEWLQQQAWPGNVRELENTIERLVVLARDGVLRPPPGGSYSYVAPFHEEKQRVIDEFERSYLERALSACDGKLAQVARRSGISPRQLYTLLRKHHLVEDEAL